MRALAPARAVTPTLTLPAFSFNKVLNAVLHLSELSHQLDVTHESSKRVKLDLTWVATVGPKAMQSKISDR
jgi:hypothetical protein